ncbi:MAG: glucosamine-6-phosphate deaminase [Actinomycetota bacterium]
MPTTTSTCSGSSPAASGRPLPAPTELPLRFPLGCSEAWGTTRDDQQGGSLPRPTVTIVDDYAALSRAAAGSISECLRRSPSARVLAATGETPMGAYAELARSKDSGAFDSARVQIYVLDEYVGAQENSRSLVEWLRRGLIEPLGIPDSHVVGLPPDGDPRACATYDDALAARGGFDLAILGIGTNGHIGFNEPPSDASSPTRLVQLSEETIASNQHYQDGTPVPHTAVTVGMAPLLASRKCLLIASGASKAPILQRAMRGPVGADVPASFLQGHPDLTVIVDAAAWPGPEA